MIRPDMNIPKDEAFDVAVSHNTGASDRTVDHGPVAIADTEGCDAAAKVDAATHHSVAADDGAVDDSVGENGFGDHGFEADETPASAPGVMRRDKDSLLRRLRLVEGQIRGLQRMVEQDKYCVDILVQVAAVRAALNKVGLMLLEDHTRGCVARAIAHDEADPAIDELMQVIHRFLR